MQQTIFDPALLKAQLHAAIEHHLNVARAAHAAGGFSLRDAELNSVEVYSNALALVFDHGDAA